MYCERCGTWIPEEANSCPSCGAPLTWQTQQTQQHPAQQRKPIPKDRIYQLLAVAVAVIAICVIAVIKTGNWFPENTEEAADYDGRSDAQSVSITSEKAEVQVGESVQASFHLGEVRYDHDDGLVWSSADPDIAEIDDAGVMTGISAGVTTIIGQCGDLSAVCEITVIAPTPQVDYAEGISYQNATFCISSGSGLAVFRDIVNGENDQLVEGWSETEAPNGMRDIDGCLENDISLAEVCNQSAQSGETPWIPIGSYEVGYYGVFDGNGYCIRDFYGKFETYQDCYAPEGDDVPGGAGLFAMNDGKIRNLALSGEIDAEIRRVGGLVGINHGVISHCITDVDIHAAEKYVGGIAGVNDGENDCYIEYCANYGDIECSYKASQNSSDETRAPKVGGITGGNWAVGYVNSCFNAGMIYVQDYIHVGGLVGKISNEDSIFRSWYPEYCCNGGEWLQLMSDQEWSVEEGQILDGDALAILDSAEWKQGATYPELITCPTPADFLNQ